MTELQVVINNLKEGVIAAELMIETLEKVKEADVHEWEHGDVFKCEFGQTMICLNIGSSNPENAKFSVFCVSGGFCDGTHASNSFLKKGKFLFNIQEKL